MKIADANFSSEASGKKILLPLIPSEDEKQEALTTFSATFLLRTQPTDTNSPMHKFTVRKISGSETCRLLIEWLLAIAKVFVGLNVTTIAAARPIAEATLEGTALRLSSQHERAFS